ncbi:hypothetical protein PHET_02386 [Paragonimus heterotremus]|uniref:Leishmanolysin-like peptidase n=1 Tax=Paragonimus heterotremus TaxID=100268 RepID=A0A8J4WTY7_9TREM|nr:hypothetical protein PHET_02386 [Paragonimus heterotremus]
MRDENGNPRTPRNPSTGLPNLGKNDHGIFIPDPNTVSTVARMWMSSQGMFKRSVRVLKTPNVLKAARKHFSCPTLEGVDLENQGGAGTDSAHFEKRVVQDEIMAGSIGKHGFVSILTLSYFLDTGWYNVNLSKAEPWKWGEDLGCDFILKSCYQYMMEHKAANRSISPWCDQVASKNTRCLQYDNAYGTCNLHQLGHVLGDEFQYFDKLPGVGSGLLSLYGSDNFLADYCPSYLARETASHLPTTFCSDIENQNNLDARTNMELQTYGEDSICLNHDSQASWVQYECSNVTRLPSIRASCHKRECSSTTGLLIHIDLNIFQCPLMGGKIRIDTTSTFVHLTGSIDCPPCSDICEESCTLVPSTSNRAMPLTSKATCYVTYRIIPDFTVKSKT